MQHLREVIAAIARDMSSIGCDYALIGGLAVSARSEPRTTRDVDLAVAVSSDEEAERVVYDLGQLGYVVLSTVEQTATNRLATARLRPPGASEGGALVDLLFASSGIEAEVAIAASSLEILLGVTVPVAQLGHLIALKLLARNDDDRPQDRIDLNALVREATPSDFDVARAAVSLIETRGYQRGRNLVEALDRLLASPAAHEDS